MNSPVISIVIPTLNRSDLLQQALNSLQKQTFKDWEALVVDDSSEDETNELTSHIDCYSDAKQERFASASFKLTAKTNF